jgi:sulfur carrier protein ThiS
VKVQVIAPFEIEGQDNEGWVELSEGSRVTAILRRAIRAPMLMRLMPVSVNGIQVHRGKRLKDGDMVIVVMPIRGG